MSKHITNKTKLTAAMSQETQFQTQDEGINPQTNKSINTMTTGTAPENLMGSAYPTSVISVKITDLTLSKMGHNQTDPLATKKALIFYALKEAGICEVNIEYCAAHNQWYFEDFIYCFYETQADISCSSKLKLLITRGAGSKDQTTNGSQELLPFNDFGADSLESIIESLCAEILQSEHPDFSTDIGSVGFFCFDVDSLAIHLSYGKLRTEVDWTESQH
jgi:hypothetical protein